MRDGIHPKYNEITVVYPNGKKFVLNSAYTKAKEIYAEVYPLDHPAWSGGRTEANANASNIADFNKKFGGLLNSIKKN
jgi:ribosomal protein L31